MQYCRYLAILVLFSSQAFANLDDAEKFRRRYPLATAKAKLVDNYGNDFEPLYGVRNFRAVLNGVYYRGGANNAYHRSDKRGNQNPLPEDGLLNLCTEGFATAIYLYAANFETASHSVDCRTADGTSNRLNYIQLSILSASKSEIYELLRLIRYHLRGDGVGPLYAHCWSGWHASGLASAYTLRQFCGFSASQAIKYWNENADGRSGAKYDPIRKKIREFVPFNNLQLTAEESAVVCPNPRTFKY